MSKDDLETFNKMMGKVERLIKLLLWCLALIISGAVWAAKIEMRLNDLAEWKVGAASDIKDHARTLENIKGRMGIAAAGAPGPSKESPSLVWKRQEEEEEQPTQ